MTMPSKEAEEGMSSMGEHLSGATQVTRAEIMSRYVLFVTFFEQCVSLLPKCNILCALIYNVSLLMYHSKLLYFIMFYHSH